MQQNIEEIYANYSKQVYKYLFCLTHNRNLSEDLTQETFYIAVKEISKFRGDCKLYVWLCQIAKHLYYKELKKQKRLNVVPIHTLENFNMLLNNTVENESVARLDAYKKINTLEKKTREIIYLRAIGNFTFKEIGELLNISETLARVTFYRGKLKMKEVNYNEEK